MDLASTLIKQIIVRQDLGTWSFLKRNYLPKELHSIWVAIDSFFERYSKIPTFKELLLDVRNKETIEKINAIELQDSEDIDPELLLDFLKNEKAQEIAFDEFTKLIIGSKGFETAQDTIESLQEIVLNIEKQIDIEDINQNMQRVNLFDSEEEIAGKYKLGINSQFDNIISFISSAYILFGGVRGTGKSIVCCNIAADAYMRGESAIIFTVEMEQREILQRICSICTGVNNNRITNRNLSISEWEAVASWWADRYTDGMEEYEEYLQHRDFDKLHASLIRKPLRSDKQIEIIYDPELTIGKLRSELERKVPLLKPKVIVVDYVNQIQISKIKDPRKGQFDWTEQIQISKTLKSLAQKFSTPVVSAFQTDKTGEARFAKGILDSADAVFSLEVFGRDVNAIAFNNTKMRGAPETDFISYINWDTLKIGPESASRPVEEEGEDIEDAQDVF